METKKGRRKVERKEEERPAVEELLDEFQFLRPRLTVHCRYARMCTSFLTKCGRCRHNRARDYFSPRKSKDGGSQPRCEE